MTWRALFGAPIRLPETSFTIRTLVIAEWALAAICFLSPSSLRAQQRARIEVSASTEVGVMPNSWAYFGYDEANYTYTSNGKQLISELVAASHDPVHIRTHFLLVSGDGGPALKFGSTNAYAETASGEPVYNWTVVDKILDTYVNAGAIPYVEIGFMPEALSSHAQPYVSDWILGEKNAGYFAGWTYPPTDYNKWERLISEWVRHSIQHFGKAEVLKWGWEVWNEPDIKYWHGTPEEYDKLYDFATDAVKRALPEARVGGPATTGPGSARAAEFLRQFLQHCATGKNYATGQIGSPLDFISFHAKGRPHVVDTRAVMGLGAQMRDADEGFKVVKHFPQFAALPIVLSEADPEGCAACSARVYPQNTYRNGTLYAAYEAAAYKTLLELAHEQSINLQGVLTWAFEFENQPYFDGFRTLATNGIDKPVLNFFRMAGLMTGQRVLAKSSAPNVDAIAAKSDRSVAVMIWNYGDDPKSGEDADVRLEVDGLPENAGRILVRHYRVDERHSNAFTAWKQMGSPQHPSREQYEQLRQAGQLQLFGSPEWLDKQTAQKLQLRLPAEAISLIEISW